MYELLAGENPFAGSSAVDTIENVLQRSVPPPSSRGAPIPQDLDQICLQALDKDPDRRFRDAQTMADVLTEYAMDLTIARKDMAAGDAAVAQLLGELFADRARGQPVAADPASLVIPGIEDSASSGSHPQLDAFVSDTGASAEAAEDRGGPVNEHDRTAPDDDDDFDAPTVLKLDPITGLEDIPTPRARSAPAQLPQDEVTGNTAPTELPGYQPSRSTPSRVDPAGPPLASEQDAFAPTIPSRAQVVSRPPEEPRPMVRLTAARARPSAYSGTPAGVAGSAPDSQDALVVPLDGRGPGRSGQRLNFVAAALLVIAVVAVIAALIAVRRGQSAADVQLTVRTRPPGATVFLNGAAC